MEDASWSGSDQSETCVTLPARTEDSCISPPLCASLSPTVDEPCTSVEDEPCTSAPSCAPFDFSTSAVITDIDSIVEEASDLVCNVGLDITVGVENDDSRDEQSQDF